MAVSLSREFWTETWERALLTAAETALALLGTLSIASLGGAVNTAIVFSWGGFALVVALATVTSVLKSVVVGLSPLGSNTTPSLVAPTGRHAADE